jgi:hypothetical protein
MECALKKKQGTFKEGFGWNRDGQQDKHPQAQLASSNFPPLQRGMGAKL